MTTSVDGRIAELETENAELRRRLTARTAESGELSARQAATSAILGVISRSAGDAEAVFEAIVASAARLCAAAFAAVARLDAGLLHLVAINYMSPKETAAFHSLFPRPPARNFAMGRACVEGRPVQFADVLAEADYDPRTLAVLQAASQYRTFLGVPIMRDGRAIGVIGCGRREVKPFTDAEITLVETLAQQAAVAIGNARLVGELRERTRDLEEALEYQTATSDVLRVLSQPVFDLQSVLQTVVARAVPLCRADSATIYRNENGEYRWAAGHMLLPEYEAIERQVRILPGPGTIVGRAASERRTVQILDAWTDPHYEAKDDARIGGVHTMIGVPLLREGAPIGVIGLARRRIEAFSEREIALVSTFADQAVIAIENARLLGELRGRTAELARSVDELQALAEVARAVSSTLDLRAVLATILARSVGLSGADAGAVFRYSRAERQFRLVEAAGWGDDLLASVGDLRVAEAETAMGEATAQRVPIQIADLARRPSFPLRDVNLDAGFRSVLIVPLVGPERILGALVLQRRATGEFPTETVRLMQTLASQSVLAIQNARLFREIAEKSEQLALASQHKSQFLANMSHELRTPLNAILGFAELLADGIYGVLPEKAQEVIERVQRNGRHLLALINDVLDLAKIEAGQLTLSLEDYSLSETVRTVAGATEPLAAAKGLAFTTRIADGLPTAHGDARRVAQVLMNLVGNAIKFTAAGEVEITAAASDGQFVLEVRDTGPGIADADQERIFGEFQQVDIANTRKQGGTGLGLAISKRMVEMQGGLISVDSALGRGSTFRVLLPVTVEPALEEAAQ